MTNFENLNAQALISALIVKGSVDANILSTGSGDDTIDGAGGGDVGVQLAHQAAPANCGRRWP